jgi:uncharacterized protein (DUF2126 family)
MIDVVNDLKDSGYNFDISWFDPFFEFRFPHHGNVTIDNVQLEIRLESSHGMYLEKSSSTGTSRFVDSSLERLQVKVSGIVPDRHILLCKGCRIPLRSRNKRRVCSWNSLQSLESTIRIAPKYWC